MHHNECCSKLPLYINFKHVYHSSTDLTIETCMVDIQAPPVGEVLPSPIFVDLASNMDNIPTFPVDEVPSTSILPPPSVYIDQSVGMGDITPLSVAEDLPSPIFAAGIADIPPPAIVVDLQPQYEPSCPP